MTTSGCVHRAREDADRLARLDDERLVLLEAPQARDDASIGLPVARRLAPRAVDDEVLGPLTDLEHVLEHPQQALLSPAAAAQRAPAGRGDRPVCRQAGSLVVYRRHSAIRSFSIHRTTGYPSATASRARTRVDSRSGQLRSARCLEASVPPGHLPIQVRLPNSFSPR